MFTRHPTPPARGHHTTSADGSAGRPHGEAVTRSSRSRERRGMLRSLGAAGVGALALGAFVVGAPVGAAAPGPFLGHMHTVTNIASTVPANGDQNPYGIVTVPVTTGSLVAGDTLISNFNDTGNTQGTGTTIVEVSPGHHVTQFADLTNDIPSDFPAGVGLTTALTVLNDGYVIVGSLPTGPDGTPSGAGELIVLNNTGDVVAQWTGNGIDGPWDLTAEQSAGHATLFLTNVLNGLSSSSGNDNPVDQGTVLRLDVATPPGVPPTLESTTPIGTNFPEENDSGAIVIGPTGVALGPDDTLYVADTVNSQIVAIPNASTRTEALTDNGTATTISSGGSLNAPLGLTLAPNGDLITVNGGDGNGVEITPQGAQVATVQFDPARHSGDLFGLTVAPNGRGVLFVDDGDNTLKLLH